MKAPDKIYMSNLIYDSWQYTIPDPDDETEVEYIRKDALIEWLENKIAENEGGFVAGLTNLAYQDVLNKLNSI